MNEPCGYHERLGGLTDAYVLGQDLDIVGFVDEIIDEIIDTTCLPDFCPNELCVSVDIRCEAFPAGSPGRRVVVKWLAYEGGADEYEEDGEVLRRIFELLGEQFLGELAAGLVRAKDMDSEERRKHLVEVLTERRSNFHEHKKRGWPCHRSWHRSIVLDAAVSPSLAACHGMQAPPLDWRREASTLLLQTSGTLRC